MPDGGELKLLDGIRIVAFSQFLMGPVACQYLADMGADVIKVEQPGRGAWERSWAGADTFINGVSAFFLLVVAEPEAIHHPGPEVLDDDVGAVDEQGPTVAGAAVVDQHSASLLAMGILGALVHRERTGEGQRVEVTLMQGALDLQMEPVVYHLNGAQLERPHSQLADTFHAAPYGLYATADGHVAISMTPIATLSEVLGHPEELEPYQDPAVAFTHRDEIRRVLDPLIRQSTTAEWVTRLRERAIWCAPVNDLAATFEDEAVRFLDPVLEFEHRAAGTVRVLQHPVRYSSGRAGLTRQPPSLGEHTREVLEEVGCSPAEIAAAEAGT